MFKVQTTTINVQINKINKQKEWISVTLLQKNEIDNYYPDKTREHFIKKHNRRTRMRFRNNCIDICRNCRGSRPEEFLAKGVLKICRKFTGENPCQSVISTKLLCNFVKVTLCHVFSPISLLHIFRTPFPKSTSGRLPLKLSKS